MSTDASKFLFLAWGLLSFFVVFSPCLFSYRLRMKWIRRIKLRKWRVSMDDIDVDVDGNPTLTSSNFVPRYPPGDPRHKISDEEAERMKKEFIAAKLKGFTKIIEQSDFVTHHRSSDGNSDIEMGISVNATFDGSESEDEENNESSGSSRAPNKELTPGENRKKKPVFLSSLSGCFSSRKSKNGKEAADQPDDDLASAKDSTSASTTLKLPSSGTKLVVDDALSCHDDNVSEEPNHSVPLRDVRPECPICLSEVTVGERMSWSPEEGCHHCFHEECITEWLMTLGKDVPVQLQKDLSIQCDFKMQCPVCRGDFISNGSNPTHE